MELGEKMKMLRAQRGLSLEAVGNIVGVGKSTVRKWENGEIKNMGRDKIALVAEALGVTPGYLMGWDEDDSAQDKLNEIKENITDVKKAEKWIMLTKMFRSMDMSEFDMWFNAISANHPEKRRNNDDDKHT